jgi:hypothetical protein
VVRVRKPEEFFSPFFIQAGNVMNGLIRTLRTKHQERQRAQVRFRMEIIFHWS